MNGIIYEILMKKLLKSVQDEISCMLFVYWQKEKHKINV